MPLGAPLIKILSKTYEPAAYIERKFRNYDIAFKTDESGQPILLFIGTKKEDGTIRGERFARRLVRDKDGRIIKDHWDDKVKAT